MNRPAERLAAVSILCGIAMLSMVSSPVVFAQNLQAELVQRVWTNEVGVTVDSVKISGNGSLVLVGLDNGSALLFRSSDGVLVRSFHPLASASAMSQRVVNTGLSFDGSYVIAIKDVYSRDGQLVARFDKIGAGGYTLSVSPTASLILSSSDTAVRLFDGFNQTKNLVWSLHFEHGVEEVRAWMSPDTKSVVVSSADTRLSMLTSAGMSRWNATFDNPVVAVALSYDASLVVVSTSDGMVRYLDSAGSISKSFLIAKAQVQVVSVPQSPSISYLAQNVAMPWAGNYVVLGDSEGRVELFDRSGVLMFNLSPSPFTLSSLPINAVDTSADGLYLAAASGGTVALFKAPSLQQPIQPQGNGLSLIPLVLLVVVIAGGVAGIGVYLVSRRRRG
ncbi:MAG: PQQ-binding-like beta-propeller repeat protein [Thaumarchaeota archaeon]|nr:PQQ-binding-like beta-propeller repeat protein [Nitrososphaerota archaeon]